MAQAVPVRATSIRADGYIEIQIQDENGEWVWVPTVDENGNPIWKEDYVSPGKWEWIPAAEARTDAQLGQLYADKKTNLEQKYGVKINDSPISGLAIRGKIDLIDSITAYFGMLPAKLTETVRTMLTARKRTLQIVFGVPYSHMDEGLGGTFNEKGDVITMYGYDQPRPFIHEYGHLVYTLVGEQYGRSTIRQWMNDLSGAPYRNDAGFDESDEFWNSFVTWYARTSVYEDFPETFSFLLAMPTVLWDMYKAEPEQFAPVIKKANYIRSLLIQTFGLAESDLPQATPPQPSAWAAAAVARFESEIGGLASYKYDDLHGYVNYQNGAPRAAFAYGAFNTASQIWVKQTHERGLAYTVFQKYNPDYSFQLDYMQRSEIEKSLNPFTDIQSNQITVLHLMGVINGKSEHIFDPDGTITREQAAAMLYRLCTALGYDFSNVTPVEPADAAACSGWALESIRMICGAGIMNGVGGGVFNPKGTYTYEQSAITLLRVYDLLRG